MDIALFCLIVFVSVSIYIINLNDKIKKLKEENYRYKYSYFTEQHQSEAYKACLYIAIKDMISNGWYKKESEAFRMMFCRIKKYKFINEFDIATLIARMLFSKDHVKFSYDYEEELLKKGR